MTEEMDPDGPPDGEALTDPNECLLRPCHHGFVHRGVPSEQAFRLASNDAKRLSTMRGSMTTAKAACEARLALGKTPAGTWGVSVEEAGNAGVPAYGDGGLRNNPPEHASCYFGGKDRMEQYAAAELLAVAAEARGCLYPYKQGRAANSWSP